MYYYSVVPMMFRMVVGFGLALGAVYPVHVLSERWLAHL